jgi:hypothetical protein
MKSRVAETATWRCRQASFPWSSWRRESPSFWVRVLAVGICVWSTKSDDEIGLIALSSPSSGTFNGAVEQLSSSELYSISEGVETGSPLSQKPSHCLLKPGRRFIRIKLTSCLDCKSKAVRAQLLLLCANPSADLGDINSTASKPEPRLLVDSITRCLDTGQVGHFASPNVLLDTPLVEADFVLLRPASGVSCRNLAVWRGEGHTLRRNRIAPSCA